MMKKNYSEKDKADISKRQINMVFDLCISGDFKSDLIDLF